MWNLLPWWGVSLPGSACTTSRASGGPADAGRALVEALPELVDLGRASGQQRARVAELTASVSEMAEPGVAADHGEAAVAQKDSVFSGLGLFVEHQRGIVASERAELLESSRLPFDGALGDDPHAR